MRVLFACALLNRQTYLEQPDAAARSTLDTLSVCSLVHSFVLQTRIAAQRSASLANERYNVRRVSYSIRLGETRGGGAHSVCVKSKAGTNNSPSASE